MILRGSVWKFGDNINTDLIAPGRYYHLRSNLKELSQHLLEDIDPEFVYKIKSGDLLVAGKNFGSGSSREHAAQIIKIAGIGAILAQSFARIFFRNAINVGFPALQCDISSMETSDVVEINMETGEIKNITKNLKIRFTPLPQVMVNILKEGGLVNYYLKNKDFII